MASKSCCTFSVRSPYATVRPAVNFNAKADCEALHKAFKGMGCREEDVIKILCKRTNDQRQQIRFQYKQLYGEDFIERLVSELKGNLEDLIVALVNTPQEYDARELHHAISGVGTTESTLIEILATRTNAEINEIKRCYRSMYNKDLETAIGGDTSGRFKRLLLLLCSGKREENHFVDQLKAKKTAEELLKQGIGDFEKTDESVFNKVFGNQSYKQLRAVFEEYKHVAGHTIYDAIEKEFSGDVKEALLAIVKAVNDTPSFFAETAYKAMKGVGTNDRKLIRVIVTRSEKDMMMIKKAFFGKYKKTLEEWIKDDTSGKYKEALITLATGNING